MKLIPTAQSQTDADVEAMRRALRSMVAASKEIADMRKALFDAHVEAGFTKEQALILCRSITL